MTAVYRRRRDRAGGSSWADAQRNAPGSYVPAHAHGELSPQSKMILRWLHQHGQPASPLEIHVGTFGVKKLLLWRPGDTTSRLGSFVGKGWLKRGSGGLFLLTDKAPSLADLQ